MATLEFSERDGAGDVRASVEPVFLSGDDPLARIDGTDDAVTCRARPIGEITIVGPGAGLESRGIGAILLTLMAPGRKVSNVRAVRSLRPNDRPGPGRRGAPAAGTHR